MFSLCVRVSLCPGPKENEKKLQFGARQGENAAEVCFRGCAGMFSWAG